MFLIAYRKSSSFVQSLSVSLFAKGEKNLVVFKFIDYKILSLFSYSTKIYFKLIIAFLGRLHVSFPAVRVVAQKLADLFISFLSRIE
jgi:hypothetical protein